MLSKGRDQLSDKNGIRVRSKKAWQSHSTGWFYHNIHNAWLVGSAHNTCFSAYNGKYRCISIFIYHAVHSSSGLIPAWEYLKDPKSEGPVFVRSKQL
jgi:hypothetical protein